MMSIADDLFEWREGKAYFRGLLVEHLPVLLGDREFQIARLRDAAALLDEADFARWFLEEDRAPYGLELWPGAAMLAEMILQGEDGVGRAALELGAGLGLVSIVAAVKGWHISASDNEPMSLRFARYNAELNGVCIPAFELVDWHQPPVVRRYDRVFGADILYQLVDHEPILVCLRTLLAPDGAALLADPNRGVADRFAALAQSHGFQVQVVPSTALRQHPVPAVRGRIFVLKLDGRPTPD